MKTIYINRYKLCNMSLPSQFTKENIDNILIYHYVEELVMDFTTYSDENFNDDEISLGELPFLLRIRFKDKSTQKDLVKLFNVSNGYASKILKKFEEKGFITRIEDPNNRRSKIVELTDKGIQKTDSIVNHVTNWENTHDLTEKELKTLKELLFKFLSNGN